MRGTLTAPAAALVVLLWTTIAAATSPAEPARPSIDDVYTQLAEGDKVTAYELLVTMAEAASDEPRVYLLKGTMERERRELSAAVDSFAAGLAVSDSRTSDAAALAYELGVTKSWASDLDGAAAAFQQALRHDPAHYVARVGLARVLNWRGRLEGAERHASTAAANEPGRPDAHAILGHVDSARLSTDAARAHYEQALALAADHAEAAAGLARLDELTRHTVTLTGGAQQSTGWQGTGGVAYRFQASRAVELAASYRAAGLELAEGAVDGTVSHQATAGARLRLSDAASVGATYGYVTSSDTSQHRVSVDPAWRVAEWLALDATLRADLGQDGDVGVLGRLGAVFIVDGGLTVGGQVFHYDDLDTFSSTAVAGYARYELAPVWLKAGASHAWLPAGGLTTVNGEVGVQLSRRFSVSVAVGQHLGAFERLELNAALTARF